jgi:hypothetical protein
MNIGKLMLISGITIPLFISCNDDDFPPAENEEEILTDVILSFDALGGATPIEVSAKDPDGGGPENIQILDELVLQPNTTYQLSIFLENSVGQERITDEVSEEADEHLFFFEWTDSLFSDPAGNGNVDNRSDIINYLDQDAEGLPLGLTSYWTTGDATLGTFRIVLKHQPGIKTSTSTVVQGETDVDLTWGLRVE